MDREDAIASLNAADEARSALAELAEPPLWRHGAFGLIVGMILVGAGLGPPYVLPSSILAIAFALVLTIHRRRISGLVANALGPTSKLPVAAVLIVVLLGASAINRHLQMQHMPLVYPLMVAFAGAIVAAAGSLIASRRYLVRLRAPLD